MSRGHGHVERTILDALARAEWSLTIAELATIVYDRAEPTTSHLVAVRRAVRHLKAARRVRAEFGVTGQPKKTVQRDRRWIWGTQEPTFQVDVPAPLLYVALADPVDDEARENLLREYGRLEDAIARR